MTPYDFVIVGAGAAGLSLAHQLLHSPLRDRSLLIVEKEAKDRNDRTWCFWSQAPTPFESIVSRSWRRLRFAGEGIERDIPLDHYRYQMIRGLDFYDFMRQELAAHPNVTFVRGRVTHIADGGASAGLRAGTDSYQGQWIFDSRFDWSRWQPDRARYHALRQHFKGWVIETPRDAFDPETVTFLDFRTPQPGEMRFFYVLPLSPRQALVEFVLHNRDHPERAMRDYIEKELGLRDYRIVAQEGGVSPLTDRPFPRRAGQRIMTIGTPGGMVKPTSGYAFTRIQRDSAAIVRSLIAHGHPLDVPASPWFFRLCDALMLHVMERNGGEIKAIFTAMFRNNPVERIFRFLDETAAPWEVAALMESVPGRPFLQAWYELKVLGRVRAPVTKLGDSL